MRYPRAANRRTDTTLRGSWLTAAKAIWVAFALTFLGFFVAGLSPRFNELRAVCADKECVVLALAQDETNALRDLGLGLEFYAGFHVGLEVLTAIVLAVLGLVIFLRRFDDWIGIILSLAVVAFGLNFMVEADSALGRLHPGLVLPLELLTAVAAVLFAILFYIFPDGRFVPTWTRVAAAILAGAALIDPFLPARSQMVPSGQVSILVLLVFLVCLSVGVVAQIYRYRRVSNPIQRQQTKWVVFGLMALLVPIVVWTLLVELFPLEPSIARLMLNLVGFSILVPLIMLFPVSIVFSILRYRLWDIDIFVNRALVYGALTAALAAAYFGSIVLLQATLRAVTGQESDVVIVASTLAIAALFQPMRRVVQRFIDRRFYRRKYDAARTLTTFGETARDEVDLGRLSGALVGVVEETMQPAHVSVWLREGNSGKRGRMKAGP